MKAMILAAGMGTRLLPLTEHKPKALLEVQGIPLLQHTIRYLMYHGVSGIVINIHHHAGQIIDFIRKHHSFGIQIEFSDETDELLDTGGGLYKARHFFNDKPFFLTASDVITDLDLKAMYLKHTEYKPLVTLAVKQRSSSREFLFDKAYRLCGWQNNTTGELKKVREVRDPLQIAFSTIHLIEPRIFDLITERGCFSLVDVYLRLAAEHIIMGFEHNHSQWFEFGRIENLDRLNSTPEIQSIYSLFQSAAEKI
jgi:NDP-sugar pyrophosphorylase family protein